MAGPRSFAGLEAAVQHDHPSVAGMEAGALPPPPDYCSEGAFGSEAPPAYEAPPSSSRRFAHGTDSSSVSISKREKTNDALTLRILGGLVSP
jgi:hypothetical protein